MKGVVILGDRNLTLSDFPDPSAGPREVALQIKASDMCGSDLHKESLRPRPMPTFWSSKEIP
jgi:D-arabinose 1-dehydrogenase-like Zn-dependent alcohol dehydrogenase